MELDEVNEDLFFPKHNAKWLRGVHRLFHRGYRLDFYRQILYRVTAFRPNFVLVYKGFPIDAEFIKRLRSLGVRIVNVYPDYTPHAYGELHRKAVGEYDLIISTKRFHPAQWRSVYGYSNQCVFVAQGYDPTLHLVRHAPRDQFFDLVLVATWRAEYGRTMTRLAALLKGHHIKVGIGGDGWERHRAKFPPDWIFGGAMHGRSYVEWLRQGKICIAPVTPEVFINGVRQLGDEDTTRTYELAASHCFFIHQRTDHVCTLYSESSEVPMFGNAEELAEKVVYFLDHAEERKAMAEATHRRAVPAYSLDARADEIVSVLSKWEHSGSVNKSASKV